MKRSWTGRGIGRNVIVLGVVSLLTDVSSEMIYPIVPLYLTAVLGAPMSVVGLIEGMAESTASLLKLASGVASDRWGRRRPFLFAGYTLSALSKPLLALAGSWPLVLGARLIDRTGKGLRGPARDAIIAASTPAEHRGTAFGFHRALDTTGAVVGPLLGVLALSVLGLSYPTIFMLAAIPGMAAVLALVALRPGPRPAAEPVDSRLKASIDPVLYRFLAVTAIFALGNSSNVFLLLRARDLGWSEGGVIGLYVLYNLVYAAAATPAGRLSDRVGRRTVLAAGFVIAALVYAGFAALQDSAGVPWLLALYGLYSAATAGVGRAYVADLSEPDSQATAQGMYQTVLGVMLLLASTGAGLLWSYFGAPAAFGFGAATASLAALSLIALCPSRTVART